MSSGFDQTKAAPWRLVWGAACLAVSLGCPAEENPNAETSSGTSGIVTASGGTGTDDTGGAETSTTGVDESTSSAGSATTGEMMCGEAEYMLEATPPNVMLVLDKSGSMDMFSWDADDDPNTPNVTRWESLYNVVELVVTTFDEQINFGAVLFPSEAALAELSFNACLVESQPEVPVAPMNGAAVLAGIPAATGDDLQGATPATAGVQTAWDHLETLDSEIPRFMILVTDGAANCSADEDPNCLGVGCGIMELYDQHLPVVVGDAFAAEIPTFVVGIDIIDQLTGVGDDAQPEANTFVELNTVADAGGKALAGNEKFFNVQNEIELEAALQDIAGQVASCIVPLEPEPTHPDFVEIEVGGQVVDRVDDCATENGWVYVNPDGPYDAVELCGTACELLIEAKTLDAKYGCPPPG